MGGLAVKKESKLLKRMALVFMLIITLMLLTGCKDYCSYGGCMREAVSGGRCSFHGGLVNDPFYGWPKK